MKLPAFMQTFQKFSKVKIFSSFNLLLRVTLDQNRYESAVVIKFNFMSNNFVSFINSFW